MNARRKTSPGQILLKRWRHSPTQLLIDNISKDVYSPRDLRAFLNHGSIAVRATTLDAIARGSSRVSADEADEVVDDLSDAASNPTNRTLLLGTISLAHVAMASLFRIGTPRAVSAAWELIDRWPEPDRTDLLWYLRSESLVPDNPGQ